MDDIINWFADRGCDGTQLIGAKRWFFKYCIMGSADDRYGVGIITLILSVFAVFGVLIALGKYLEMSEKKNQPQPQPPQPPTQSD